MEEGGGGLAAMGWRTEEAGGEGVFAPTEYEWGNGGRRVTKGEQCFGLGRACLKFGESTNFAPLLNFGPTAGRG